MNHQDLKVAPIFLRPAHKHRDSRSFSSQCEIAITQLLCQWHILSHITGPEWGWLLPACLLEQIIVALVLQQFSFYSTKLSWNKWPQAHCSYNCNQVGHICKDLQMFLMNIFFMLQLAILYNNSFNEQSNDIPANIYLALLQRTIADNIWSYTIVV